MSEILFSDIRAIFW